MVLILGSVISGSARSGPKPSRDRIELSIENASLMFGGTAGETMLVGASGIGLPKSGAPERCC